MPKTEMGKKIAKLIDKVEVLVESAKAVKTEIEQLQEDQSK